MKPDHLPDISGERTTLQIPRTTLTLVLVVIGVGGIVLAAAVAAASENGWAHFFHSYLMNFCYFLSISLGALFFVAVQHVSRAGWSVTVRRLAEILSGNLVLLGLLFLPILVAVVTRQTSLYPWLDPEAIAHGHGELPKTRYYLNVPFFVVRCLGYFAIWALLSSFFLSRSRRQDDTGEPELTSKLEAFSAPAIVLFAVTVTFASFDLLMSLDPHWFSTMYGVYVFSGAVVGGLSAVILLAMVLQSRGLLASSITADHYHELGKLLLGFVIFWGYIAFSQYMLIWYANIPEETLWYEARQAGPWIGVSLVLLFGHLLIPFFALMPRGVKRNRVALAGWAVWLLVMHWIDMYYLVMPQLAPGQLTFGLIDVGCLVGLGSLYLAGTLLMAGDRSLVPLKDPRLKEALAYHNP